MRQQLDLQVYGLSGVKEELMLFCMDRLIHHTRAGAGGTQRGGKILAIEGSPGVGKTHLIKTLAKCWGLPFQGIAAGGCKDSSFWDGHGITYEGAVPGRIVKALRQAKTMSPVIYIDELDKLSDHEHSKDVTGILLHILDESQNSEFFDKYIGEIPLDLSNVLWVISINDRNGINPVLRDRLYILKVPDPKVKDKVEMVNQIMLPEIMKIHGLNEEDIVLPSETVAYLIQSKTSEEKGVRRLKQLLEAIVKRVAYLKHTLIALPPAAVYHAAASDIIMNASQSKPIVRQQQSSSAQRQQQKADFTKQTSFYFPDFRLPLLITDKVVDQLLSHYEVDDLFDYRKSGWIM
jgi:ATP-dependent Lon protease